MGRAILVAIDLTDASAQACLWAMYEFYKPGDVFHIVHVARHYTPQLTIQHSYHATYNIPDPKPAIDEAAYQQDLKEHIKVRFTKAMDALHMPHNLHLYLDTDNAPASAISAIIFKVAEEVGACSIILASHNKGSELGADWSSYLLGSVADYCVRNAKPPVIVVRQYTAPEAAS